MSLAKVSELLMASNNYHGGVKDPRKRVFHEKGSGISAVLSLSLAKGEESVKEFWVLSELFLEEACV